MHLSEVAAMTGNRKGPVTTTNTDPLPSAGTPAEAVSADIVRLQQKLVKSVLPTGAFMTDDHRYYFNGDGPVPVSHHCPRDPR